MQNNQWVAWPVLPTHQAAVLPCRATRFDIWATATTGTEGRQGSKFNLRSPDSNERDPPCLPRLHDEAFPP